VENKSAVLHEQTLRLSALTKKDFVIRSSYINITLSRKFNLYEKVDLPHIFTVSIYKEN